MVGVLACTLDRTKPYLWEKEKTVARGETSNIKAVRVRYRKVEHHGNLVLSNCRRDFISEGITSEMVADMMVPAIIKIAEEEAKARCRTESSRFPFDEFLHLDGIDIEIAEPR
jgi:hypothetical protein